MTIIRRMHLQKSIDSKTDELSPVILKGLGGEENLVDIDACATRLRLTVHNSDLIDKEILKSTGARGVIKKVQEFR